MYLVNKAFPYVEIHKHINYTYVLYIHVYPELHTKKLPSKQTQSSNHQQKFLPQIIIHSFFSKRKIQFEKISFPLPQHLALRLQVGHFIQWRYLTEKASSRWERSPKTVGWRLMDVPGRFFHSMEKKKRGLKINVFTGYNFGAHVPNLSKL